ncbi:hypothetical protein STEG23_021054 [Scotinomys teguina]
MNRRPQSKTKDAQCDSVSHKEPVKTGSDHKPLDPDVPHPHSKPLDPDVSYPHSKPLDPDVPYPHSKPLDPDVRYPHSKPLDPDVSYPHSGPLPFFLLKNTAEHSGIAGFCVDPRLIVHTHRGAKEQ